MEKEVAVDSSPVDDTSAHESESILSHPTPQPLHEIESRKPESNAVSCSFCA